jgi:thiosulfate dehydrogenase (quinone) large subunit
MQLAPRYQAAVAGLRILVGVIFVWAGLEKILGAGPEGWSAAGFLQFGTAGSLGWPFVGADAEGPFNPTQGFWTSLADSEGAMGVINFLVPWGQLGIGVSLVLGFLTRFGAAMGTLMMLFFFVAAWDFQYGIVNQHLTYAMVVAFLGWIGAGRFSGLDATYGANMSPGLRRWIFSGRVIQE